MKQSGLRNGFIEICRLIFMLCVISHHALFYEGHGHIPFIGGYIAVEFFFMLTGFFLVSTARKTGREYDSTFHVTILKIKKVYPYFLGAWLISFAIFHVLSRSGIVKIVDSLLNGIPQIFLMSMAGLSGGTIGYHDYVGTGWYLSAFVVALFAVYPVLRCFCKPNSTWGEELFLGGIAPFVALICYGYIGFNYNSLGVVNERVAYCYLGIFRAVGGICLGCFSRHLVTKLRHIQLTPSGDYLMSTVQVMLLVLSLVLMEHYKGFNDILQLFVFFGLISISFGFDTTLNRKCSFQLTQKFGTWSMIAYISQCLVYMYPILKFPSTWAMQYLAHFVYVFAAAILNYLLVHLFKRMIQMLSVKERLFRCDVSEDSKDRKV